MKHLLRYLAILLVIPCGMLLSTLAFAQTPPPATNTANSQVCTSFAQSASTMDTSTTPGMLTNITKYIKGIVDGATQKLYEAFTGSTAYTGAVGAAILLTIVFFAVGFTTGLIQASFGEVLKRLVKIGLILTLIAPTGFDFFNQYVVHFFNDGTDELIGGVMAIGTGTTYDPAAGPFQTLDRLAAFVLQPDTLVAILGSTFSGGPFGLAMGTLLFTAVFGLLKMILEALKIYAVALVVRSLLLGVAPVFIAFLLFERTKPMFTSWVNSLLNLSLQPILYFTFLSFFMVMMTQASKDMLNTELCWTEYKGVNGAQNKFASWRPTEKNPDGTISPITDQMDWKGTLGCRLGPNPEKCKPFPIDIVPLLSFLLLVYVAQKFSETIVSMSGEISNVLVNIDKSARPAFDSLNTSPGGGNAGANGPNPNTGGATPQPSPKPLGTGRGTPGG